MTNPNNNINPADVLRARDEIDEKSANFRYDTRDYTLEYIYDKMKNGVIFAPYYQRNYIWPKEYRSYFIESLFLQLPIPIIFLATRKEKRGRFEIVDGYQRMKAVSEFIDGDLVLEGLEEIPSLNGFTFNDLSPSLQEEFKNYSLRIVTLDKLRGKLIQDLFKRINTTSEQLTEFEIIRGTYRNDFITMIEELEKDSDFCSLTPLSKSRCDNDRHERGYLLLSFFVFLDHYKEIPGGLSKYLRNFAKNVAPKLTPEQLEDYREIFRKTLDFVKVNFGEFGFGKSPNATPRFRFDILSVGLALALRQKPKLKSSKEKINRFLSSDEFKGLIPKGGSVNSKSFIAGIENVRDFFLGKKTK